MGNLAPNGNLKITHLAREYTGIHICPSNNLFGFQSAVLDWEDGTSTRCNQCGEHHPEYLDIIDYVEVRKLRGEKSILVTLRGAGSEHQQRYTRLDIIKSLEKSIGAQFVHPIMHGRKWTPYKGLKFSDLTADPHVAFTLCFPLAKWRGLK